MELRIVMLGISAIAISGNIFEKVVTVVVKPVRKSNNPANRAELQELITELPPDQLIETLKNKRFDLPDTDARIKPSDSGW